MYSLKPLLNRSRADFPKSAYVGGMVAMVLVITCDKQKSINLSENRHNCITIHPKLLDGDIFEMHKNPINIS